MTVPLLRFGAIIGLALLFLWVFAQHTARSDAAMIYGLPVVNGVVQVPASALRQYSRAQIAAAILYAKRNRIRWRVVRGR